MAVEDVRMGKVKRGFKDSQVSGLGNRVKCGIFPNTGHMREKQGCEVGLMSYSLETGLGQRQSFQGPVLGRAKERGHATLPQTLT